jgi:hypothetical protein
MIMNMMRTAALLLLLSINGSNATRRNKKSHLRELKNDQGPCGSISSELQANVEFRMSIANLPMPREMISV